MPNSSKRMPASAASAPSSPRSPAPAGTPADSRRPHSTDGVAHLIETACALHEQRALANVFSPLFPETCPWASLAGIPEQIGRRHALQLKAIAAAAADYRTSLTATAGRLSRWLDASEEDIRELALRFARYRLPAIQKLSWASRLLGGKIPGTSPASQMARVNDARFWRRAIRTTLLREREHFYLRLALLGRGRETYVSDAQLSTRLAQLRRQKQWLEETVLVPRYLVPGEANDGLLTLAKVAASPRTRFAKLYTFVKAMDRLSQEAGLASAMVTLTLEPEWHPSPSHGKNTWNGASPREGHRLMAARWQAILIALHKAGIGVSGLRVVEPHQDACPHWHVWLLYRPEAETDILAAVMRQFPHKLKVRAPSRRGETAHAGDVMFDSRGDALTGASRPLTHPKEGAQVEVSKIDRSISSGASYAMKYLLKTVDGGEPLNKQVDLFGDAEQGDTSDDAKKARQAKRKAHQESARRVDAYRSLWGINAGQLFGVARCLSAWDELRRLTTRPDDAMLCRLWTLARGSDKEGHIPAGHGERGDAKGFLEALGGLVAAQDPKAKTGKATLRLGRLTETRLNGYGEEIQRARGLALIQSQRRAEKRPGKRAGRPRTVWKTVKSVLAQVVTRTQTWSLVPKARQAVAIAAAEAAFMADLYASAPALAGHGKRHERGGCAATPVSTLPDPLPPSG